MKPNTLFRNANIWDGTGAKTYVGDALIVGDRIAKVSKTRIADPQATVIDAAGLTLMPGLVEGHAHLSFHKAVRNTDLGDIPPEEHLLITMHNAKTLLDAGFTSAYSAASAKLRLDVVIRNEINAGAIPGPRLRAAGPEITITGGLGDEDRQHQQRSSFGMVADGIEAIVKATRLCAREGVDNIKINISGDDFINPAKGDVTVMSEAEVQAAVDTAHAHRKRISAHARAAESVKRAVRCGVDVIYHCESADEEALDMLEEAKDRIFVGPAIGLIYGGLYEAEPWGMTHERACSLGLDRCLENTQKVYAELRKRGVRVLVGGDYGFAWVPQGTNARDIEHYVKLFGYSPSEALQCATRIGGEVMGMGDELGKVAKGYIADLLLVNGDPVADVRVLQDKDRLVAIMQGGRFHKMALPKSAARHAANAAE
jgi:imidazolonepropionase-like amidohydrolase